MGGAGTASSGKMLLPTMDSIGVEDELGRLLSILRHINRVQVAPAMAATSESASCTRHGAVPAQPVGKVRGRTGCDEERGAARTRCANQASANDAAVGFEVGVGRGIRRLGPVCAQKRRRTCTQGL